MTRLTLCLCSVLMILLAKADAFTGPSSSFSIISEENTDLNLSAAEALDMVKEKYAANFEKVYYEQEGTDTAGEVSYYYKLPIAEYYLTYEGQGETQEIYLIHLYEFVTDEPDTGIGHTVTYGWYSVNRRTGYITDETQ